MHVRMRFLWARCLTRRSTPLRLPPCSAQERVRTRAVPAPMVTLYRESGAGRDGSTALIYWGDNSHRPESGGPRRALSGLYWVMRRSKGSSRGCKGVPQVSSPARLPMAQRFRARWAFRRWRTSPCSPRRRLHVTFTHMNLNSVSGMAY